MQPEMTDSTLRQAQGERSSKPVHGEPVEPQVQTSQQVNVLPSEWVKDSQGRLVPVAMVKEIDKLRDELVKKVLRRAEEASMVLRRFKEDAFSEIAAFCSLSAQEYGREMGGEKGNITLVSYDGKFKVVQGMPGRGRKSGL